MNRHAIFVLSLALLLAPLAAKADLWINVRRPISVTPASIDSFPGMDCELMYHGPTKETVRCADAFGKTFRSVITTTPGEMPDMNMRTIIYNYYDRGVSKPSSCSTSFLFKGPSQNWYARTKGSSGCVQWWQNANTLDVYIKR